MMLPYLFPGFYLLWTLIRNIDIFIVIGVWITAMESFPGFALYRVFYEFSLKARDAKVGHTPGMKWQDLNDRTTGMKELLIIMVVEWFIFLSVTYCIDKKSSLFRVKTSSSEMNSMQAFDQVEKADVAREVSLFIVHTYFCKEMFNPSAAHAYKYLHTYIYVYK